MKEILNEVLAAEDKADKIMSEAREKAAGIKNSIDAENNARITETRDKAGVKMKNEIQAARETAEKALQEASETAERKTAQFKSENSGKITGLVSKIAQFIISPEYTR